MATSTSLDYSEFKTNFDYRSNRNGRLRWILSHAKRHWIFIVGIIGFQLVASFAQNSIPNLIQIIVDLYVDDKLFPGNLTELSLLVLVYGLGVGLFSFFRNLSSETIGQRLERDARDELYSSLLGKSLTYHDGQKIGDLMSRVSTDVRQLNFMLNPGFNLVFAAITSTIMTLYFIALINVDLLLVPVIYMVVFLIVLKRYNDKLSPWAMKTRMEVANVTSRLNETLTGMHVVRGAAQEDKEFAIFEENIERAKQARIKIGSIQARYWPLLILGIATALGIIHGLLLYDQGTITIGQFIAYILLLQLLRFPTFINIFAITVLSLGLAAAERILEVMNAESEISENERGYAQKIEDNIRFESVSFGYNGKTNGSLVLREIDFEIARGQTVALIGVTGSGKTTVTKLLSRLYDPNEGKILVDGIDLKDWSLESLRDQMALVEQDIFLFSKSISENIALGRREISREEIVQAAKLAHAHEFIEELEDGYDTVIGERGVTLSGGQRQRIAIARAILKDPSILILDDSSSAIDSQTEDEINRAILNVLENRISIIITHRIAQIRKADLIILMDEGTILEKGNHDFMMKHSNRYREIFSSLDRGVN